jgi:hypothetical protein
MPLLRRLRKRNRLKRSLLLHQLFRRRKRKSLLLPMNLLLQKRWLR